MHVLTQSYTMGSSWFSRSYRYSRQPVLYLLSFHVFSTEYIGNCKPQVNNPMVSLLKIHLFSYFQRIQTICVILSSFNRVNLGLLPYTFIINSIITQPVPGSRQTGKKEGEQEKENRGSVFSRQPPFLGSSQLPRASVVTTEITSVLWETINN